MLRVRDFCSSAPTTVGRLEGDTERVSLTVFLVVLCRAEKGRISPTGETDRNRLVQTQRARGRGEGAKRVSKSKIVGTQDSPKMKLYCIN
jgi:hypothetical protein